jgi:NADH-quinone oxidoreductase subunit N
MNTPLAAAPLAALSAGAIAALLADAFKPRAGRSLGMWISLLSTGAAFALLCLSWNRDAFFFGGSLRLDGVSIVLGGIILALGALVALVGAKPGPPLAATGGAFHPLLLLAIAGILAMISTQDLLVVFIGLEIASVSCYALSGLAASDPKSNEAAVKYFMLGSFASAFLVFGLAFLYGTGGGTALPELLSPGRADAGVLALAGWALFTVGMGFKIALVPFHGWAPDVYEGSPTPVAAFLSVGPKAAGLAVLIRISLAAAPAAAAGSALPRLLAALAAATMLVGNLAALRQTNVKRLLAYSSISHSGYLLLAVLARSWTGLLFYLAAYVFMNVGAFATLAAVRREDGEEAVEIDDLSGAGFRYPWIGACFAACLLSLAGFPPTAGFLGKFLVFGAAVREGWTWLVVVAVAGTLVSVFYYLKVVVVLYMAEPARRTSVDPENLALYFVLFLCGLAVFVLGLFPGNILALIRRAAGGL